MTRVKAADVSPDSCRDYCCSAGAACNAWSWHAVPGGQCHVSPAKLSPIHCHPAGKGQWQGESRGQPAPSPPSPRPKRAWNLQPGLLPPKGMWRGATIDKRFPPVAGEGVVGAFEAAYGYRLHIYRTFKTENWYEITPEETAFIDAGGILFYSIEPKNWSAWVDWHAAWKIKRFADAIKAVAPAQVLIAPGCSQRESNPRARCAARCPAHARQEIDRSGLAADTSQTGTRASHRTTRNWCTATRRSTGGCSATLGTCSRRRT